MMAATPATSTSPTSAPSHRTATAAADTDSFPRLSTSSSLSQAQLLTQSSPMFTSPSSSRPSSSSSPSAATGDAQTDTASTSPSTSPSKQSKAILGPNGKYFTPGEAAKLGLIIRTACEACRSRKLKCSGTPPEQGGCQRCKTDDIACIYTARAPIGRPKKRKAEDGEVQEGGPNCCQKKSGDPPTSSNGTSSSGSLKSRRKSQAQKRESSVSTAVAGQHISPASKWMPVASSSRVKIDVSSPWQEQSTPLPGRSDFAQLLSAAAAVHSQGFTPGIGSGQHGLAMHGYSTSLGHAVPHEFTNSHQGPHGAEQSHLADYPGTSAGTFQFVPAPDSAPSLPPARSHPSKPPTANEQTGVPSLDDLSIAAFLQSLDTLEIAPAELLTTTQHHRSTSALASHAPHRLGARHPPFGEAEGIASSGRDRSGNAHGLPGPNPSAPGAVPLSQCPSNSPRLDRPLTDADLEAQFNEWSSSSAILQDGLSFAVPADFSWWDLGLDPDLSSAGVTPATEATRVEPWSVGSVPVSSPAASLQQGTRSVQHRADMHRSGASPDLHDRTERRDGLQISTNWPRGAENGMGQGQLVTTGTASATGLSWASIPQSPGTATSDKFDRAPSSSSSPGIANARQDSVEAAQPSCCSSRQPGAPRGATQTVTQNDEERHAPGLEQLASCCSKNKVVETSPPARDAHAEAARSCCSQKVSATLKEPVVISPTGSNATERSAATTAASTAQPHPSKVHCVPNPSGKGCTCLCDMSVALLSVKRTLRETTSPRESERMLSGAGADDHLESSADSSYRIKQEGGSDLPSSTDSAPRRKAAAARAASTTIQLTLSASQAIAAQCACSADCPTCRSDPSTEVSASLLVSTALQIYARAVRTLREGFAAGGAFAVIGAGGAAGGLDVRIGEYKPAPSNARRIALFAMKLELKDLSTALGKISRMARKSKQRGRRTAESSNRVAGAEYIDGAPRTGHGKAQAGCVSGDGHGEEYGGSTTTASKDAGWMNPIDQLVIMKLHQQLGELLATVENLEAQSSSGGAVAGRHHHQH